jgi:hypothetical protein
MHALICLDDNRIDGRGSITRGAGHGSEYKGVGCVAR